MIGTFALDGPEKCSGLPVQRYDPATLSRTIGPGFALIAEEPHRHATPWAQRSRFSSAFCEGNDRLRSCMGRAIC